MLKIAHIGIAVKNLESSLSFYALMGIDPSHTEEVSSQKVNTAFLHIGGTDVELLEPTSADASVAKFIEKRGEGIHHIAYEVDDIHGLLAKLKENGVRLIDETPFIGAHNMLCAFIHPKSASGVLTELCQPNTAKPII